MIVAQLAEIRGSNPDIGKILSTNFTAEKMKMKKKRPGMAHLKKGDKQVAIFSKEERQ